MSDTARGSTNAVDKLLGHTEDQQAALIRRQSSDSGTQNRLSTSIFLRRDNVIAFETLGPHASCSITLFVFNQSPPTGDWLTAVWTATESRFVATHREVEGACDMSLPSECIDASKISVWRACGVNALDFKLVLYPNKGVHRPRSPVHAAT